MPPDRQERKPRTRAPEEDTSEDAQKPRDQGSAKTRRSQGFDWGNEKELPVLPGTKQSQRPSGSPLDCRGGRHYRQGDRTRSQSRAPRRTSGAALPVITRRTTFRRKPLANLVCLDVSHLVDIGCFGALRPQNAALPEKLTCAQRGLTTNPCTQPLPASASRLQDVLRIRCSRLLTGLPAQ